jgi:methylated-DNA-[protein]-cysteine S-methyltransferase
MQPPGPLAGFWKVMGIVPTSVLTFETAIGRCAVRWSDLGITAVLLPGRSIPEPQTTEDRADLPAFVRRAIDGITTLLAGGADDLRDIPLDDRGVDHLRRAVYAETRTIDPGTTRSYGEIARAIGRPDGAREVGAALARNPFSIVVPCHRVVAANGALTGFSAPGGLATKRRMLEIEGAPGYGQQSLFG